LGYSCVLLKTPALLLNYLLRPGIAPTGNRKVLKLIQDQNHGK
jgi:hypothetical protein